MGLMLRVVLLVIWLNYTTASITVTRDVKDSFTVQDTSQCHLYNSFIQSPTSCKCDWSKKHDFIFNKDEKIGCEDGEEVTDCKVIFIKKSGDLEKLLKKRICKRNSDIEAYLWNVNDDDESVNDDDRHWNWVDVSEHIHQLWRFQNFDNLRGHLLKVECPSSKTSCKLIKFKGTLEYPVNFSNMFTNTSTTIVTKTKYIQQLPTSMNLPIKPHTTPHTPSSTYPETSIVTLKTTSTIPSNDHSKQDDDQDIIVTLSVVIVVLLVPVVFALVYFFRKRSKGAKRKDSNNGSTPAHINSVYTTQIVENDGEYMKLATPHPYAQINPDQVYAVIDETLDDSNGDNYTALQLPSKHHSSQVYAGLNYPPKEKSSTLTPLTNDAVYEGPDYQVLETDNPADDYNKTDHLD